MVEPASPPENNAHPFLDSDHPLDHFFYQWQSGTLPKSSWTHAAPVAVAARLAFDHPPDRALELTRSGIIHHNESVGTANTETSGYHETLTRFWSGLIGDTVRSGNFLSRLAAVRHAVTKFGNDRSAFRPYYSFDVVNDHRARREWVPPDLDPINM
jgi:hypothetical protein